MKENQEGERSVQRHWWMKQVRRKYNLNAPAAAAAVSTGSRTAHTDWQVRIARSRIAASPASSVMYLCLFVYCRHLIQVYLWLRLLATDRRTITDALWIMIARRTTLLGSPVRFIFGPFALNQLHTGYGSPRKCRLDHFISSLSWRIPSVWIRARFCMPPV